jgi:carboxypeptidase Q
MNKSTRAFALAVAVFAGCTSSQRDATTKPVPTVQPTTPAAMDPVIARIRDEGLERSEVMDTLDCLLNVIGPRLTASPNQQRASEWARDQLATWGLSNTHLEPWGPFGRGWQVDRYSFRVTAPTYFNPIGYPRAWSPGFDAPLSAEVVFLDAKDEADLADYEGELKGKIVLIGQPRNVDARFEPLAKRLTDEELKKLADYKPGQERVPERQAAETANERRARFAAANARSESLMKRGVTTLAGARPTSIATTRATSRSTTRSTTRRAAATTAASGPATTQGFGRGYDAFTMRMLAFAYDEGAALIVNASWNGDGGTFFVQGAAIPNDPPRSGWSTTRPRVWSDDAPKIPPQVTLAVEDYNRLARIARRGEPVKADVDMATSFHGMTISPVNTIAEIPGTDLADEVVMVGAHLDSWHSGTGATDNGVGSACAMEAIRIIKALNLKPRRTIRVALWTGEEQGIFGSAGYVKQHFGYVPEEVEVPTTKESPATTMAVTEFGTPSAASGPSSTLSSTSSATIKASRDLVKLAEYEKLSAYFNLDNGTGKIRGIYTQGNAAAAPIFREWLKPFADLDARTVTMQDTGGTDHLSFDAVGLPGFQFIQDPIEYGTRTHHSNMDVYDRIQPEDAKQASTIMAAFIWNAANMPERFPRKPFNAPK